jgi:hypothetical protein
MCTNQCRDHVLIELHWAQYPMIFADIRPHHNYSRLAVHQNKEFKFSKHQLDTRKAKVNKLDKSGDGAVENVGKVSRPCSKTVELFQHDRDDPFANIHVCRAYTAEAVAGVKQREADRAALALALSHPREHALGRGSTGVEAAAAPPRPVPDQQGPSSSQRGDRDATPNFQTVSRNQRDLLNPADRMVSVCICRHFFDNQYLLMFG